MNQHPSIVAAMGLVAGQHNGSCTKAHEYGDIGGRLSLNKLNICTPENVTCEVITG